MGKLRVAFIGCGGQATGNIYPHIASNPEMELVACCDLVEEKVKRNAEKFGAKAWYLDYEKMLDNEEVDAVFVVGHPHMHTELGSRVWKKDTTFSRRNPRPPIWPTPSAWQKRRSAWANPVK